MIFFGRQCDVLTRSLGITRTLADNEKFYIHSIKKCGRTDFAWSHEYKRLIYGEPLCNTGADLLGIWMRNRCFPRNVVACIMSFIDIKAWWDSHVVRMSRGADVTW